MNLVAQICAVTIADYTSQILIESAMRGPAHKNDPRQLPQIANVYLPQIISSNAKRLLDYNVPQGEKTLIIGITLKINYISCLIPPAMRRKKVPPSARALCLGN